MRKLTEKEMDERMRGCMDCRKGIPEDVNGSEWYRIGYGRQFEWEQMLTANNIKQETIH